MEEEIGKEKLTDGDDVIVTINLKVVSPFNKEGEEDAQSGDNLEEADNTSEDDPESPQSVEGKIVKVVQKGKKKHRGTTSSYDESEEHKKKKKNLITEPSKTPIKDASKSPSKTPVKEQALHLKADKMRVKKVRKPKKAEDADYLASSSVSEIHPGKKVLLRKNSETRKSGISMITPPSTPKEVSKDQEEDLEEAEMHGSSATKTRESESPRFTKEGGEMALSDDEKEKCKEKNESHDKTPETSPDSATDELVVDSVEKSEENSAVSENEINDALYTEKKNIPIITVEERGRKHRSKKKKHNRRRTVTPSKHKTLVANLRSNNEPNLSEAEEEDIEERKRKAERLTSSDAGEKQHEEGKISELKSGYTRPKSGSILGDSNNIKEKVSNWWDEPNGDSDDKGSENLSPHKVKFQAEPPSPTETDDNDDVKSNIALSTEKTSTEDRPEEKEVEEASTETEERQDDTKQEILENQDDKKEKKEETKEKKEDKKEKKDEKKDKKSEKKEKKPAVGDEVAVSDEREVQKEGVPVVSSKDEEKEPTIEESPHKVKKSRPKNNEESPQKIRKVHPSRSKSKKHRTEKHPLSPRHKKKKHGKDVNQKKMVRRSSDPELVPSDARGKGTDKSREMRPRRKPMRRAATVSPGDKGETRVGAPELTRIKAKKAEHVRKMEQQAGTELDENALTQRVSSVVKNASSIFDEKVMVLFDEKAEPMLSPFFEKMTPHARRRRHTKFLTYLLGAASSHTQEEIAVSHKRVREMGVSHEHFERHQQLLSETLIQLEVDPVLVEAVLMLGNSVEESILGNKTDKKDK